MCVCKLTYRLLKNTAQQTQTETEYFRLQYCLYLVKYTDLNKPESSQLPLFNLMNTNQTQIKDIYQTMIKYCTFVSLTLQIGHCPDLAASAVLNTLVFIKS